MTQASIRTLTEARRSPLPVHYPGAAAEHVYFEGLADPIHLHLVALAPHQTIAIDAMAAGRVLYVWEGVVNVGETELLRGSSLMVECCGAVHLLAGEVGAILFSFTSTDAQLARPTASAYLLPVDQVTQHKPQAWPENAAEGSECQIGHAIHAEPSDMAGSAWLREQRFSGMDQTIGSALAENSLPAPSSPEVIVVIEGTMRLGDRLLGPGTAIALPAHAPYGFFPGEGGLHIIRYQA